MIVIMITGAERHRLSQQLSHLNHDDDDNNNEETDNNDNVDNDNDYRSCVYLLVPWTKRHRLLCKLVILIMMIMIMFAGAVSTC